VEKSVDFMLFLSKFDFKALNLIYKLKLRI
jgi:hypothetical protein